MTSQAPATLPTPTVSETLWLDHIACCRDDTLTLCGQDLSDTTWAPGPGVDCVPCHVAAERGEPCPRVGRCADDVGVLS